MKHRAPTKIVRMVTACSGKVGAHDRDVELESRVNNEMAPTMHARIRLVWAFKVVVGWERKVVRGMTIHLPKDLEQFIHDAVLVGRYAHEEDVIRDALTRLRQAMPSDSPITDRRAKRPKAVRRKKKLTEAEFDQHLLDVGLLSQIPDTDADFDDPDDQPVDIKGEPLSETIIRERR